MKKKDFREKLIEVRKAQGLTQEEVAKKCKITVRTIQRLESGKSIPRAYTIKAISENLGFSFFETSEDHVKDKEQQSSRKPKTFYWYVKDLFNLKTNAMQKISIFATPFLLIGFTIFFFFNSETSAQTIDYRSSLNNYAFNLYHDIKTDKENLFISPLSTYNALLMAYEGSKNKTKQEFEKVLYLNNSGALDNKYFHNFTTKLDSCPNIKVSNAIWLDKNFVVEGEFSKSLSEKYFSDFEQTEFANTETAISDINRWFSEKTNHNINEIISNSDIDADTKLLISNAIYFKGEWLLKFNKQETISAPFFTSFENQYSVDFMNMTESLRYFESEEFQFISKPYRNSDLSFGIFLPKKLFGLVEIEKKLNNEFFNEILDSASYVKTALSLPKLKLESSFELSDVLKGNGLKTAFTNEADFSGITKETPVQLSKVLHKTWIELDEENTEAASATATGVRVTGLPSYKVFKADHPFVFFIFDNKTKVILFLGRYVKPLNGEEIQKENLTHNLEKRKQEKLEVGYEGDRTLFVVENEIVSQSYFQTINPDDIESVQVYKDKKEVAKYSPENYEGVIVITIKKDVQNK